MDRDDDMLELLYRATVKDDFRGEQWEALATRLVTRALPVLSAAIASRRIFGQLAEQGLRFAASPLRPREHEIDELALDAVFEGLRRLTRRGREGRGWHPDGGASLDSWFYGGCLREFSNVWRGWLRSNGWQLEEFQDLEGLARLADCATGPEQRAVYYDALQRVISEIRDSETRRIVQMRFNAYSFHEISEEIGKSENSVKKRYYRYLDQSPLRREDD